MNRFIHIPYFEDFFKSIKLALKNFGVLHNVKEYNHFAHIIGMDGVNASTMFSALLNSGSGKDLKVRELLLILDNLDSGSQKIILDNLAKRYDFLIISESQSKKPSFDDFKKMILNFQVDLGDISSSYLDITKDNKISPAEIKEFTDLLYLLRAHVRQLEVDFEKSVEL